MRPARLAFLGLALLVLASCKQKEAVPSDLLPPEKMEALLWDLMRADQFNQDYRFILDTTLNRTTTNTRLYGEVLSLHQVSQEQFRSSFLYYRARPELLKALMDSVSRRQLFAIDPTLTPVKVDSLPAGEMPPIPTPVSGGEAPSAY